MKRKAGRSSTKRALTVPLAGRLTRLDSHYQPIDDYTMAPRKLRTDEKIEVLRGCVEQGSQTQAIDCLHKALTERSNFLVTKAAQFAAERLTYALIPDLRAAFERFAGDDAPQVDKTCAAKQAIARWLASSR